MKIIYFMTSITVLGIVILVLTCSHAEIMSGGSVFTLKDIVPFETTERLGINEGDPFTWYTRVKGGEIRMVKALSDEFINQITVRAENGPDYDESPDFKDGQGNESLWMVPTNEHITKIISTFNEDSLISLQFVTDRESASPKFGGDGEGEEQILYIETGYQLIGMYGTRDQHITSIGFYVDKIPKIMKTPIFGENFDKENPIEGQLPFQWKTTVEYGQIRQISGYQGVFIHQISFKVKQKIGQETSPPFGVQNGYPLSWTVPANEHVKEIVYTLDPSNQLRSLVFKTDKGTTSPKFGGQGQVDGIVQKSYVIPDGYMLVGAYGSAGSIVSRIGFFIGKMKVFHTRMYGDQRGVFQSWEAVDPDTEIARLTGRDGFYIDQLQFIMRNGESSPQLGGTGGSADDFTLLEDESVRKVIIRTGDFLDSARFITNKGNEYKFGGNGGRVEFIVYVPFGFNLAGFKITTVEWVRSLGLIFK